MSRKSFFCIDGHTCGNPVRLVAGGAPDLKGTTISEKRSHFLKEFDWIRRGLMFEPRGHDMMSGSMLYPPSDPANDVAVLFIETSGCLPMCGHGTIGTVTMAIEEGLVSPKVAGKLRLETPAGLVEVSYKEEGGRVRSVRLTNVASYLAHENWEVDCDALGKLTFDVAYGGNFYAIIDPQENFAGIQAHTTDELVRWSREIRTRIQDKYSVQHPENEAINKVSHVLWAGDTMHPDATARNAVFYGDKAIDRSPCGTGTSARMAQWHAQGRLKAGQEFVHESVIGSQFIGRIEGETLLGGKPAIIPSIEGWAIKTGYNTLFIDDEDPFKNGFSVL